MTLSDFTRRKWRELSQMSSLRRWVPWGVKMTSQQGQRTACAEVREHLAPTWLTSTFPCALLLLRLCPVFLEHKWRRLRFNVSVWLRRVTRVNRHSVPFTWKLNPAGIKRGKNFRYEVLDVCFEGGGDGGGAFWGKKTNAFLSCIPIFLVIS